MSYFGSPTITSIFLAQQQGHCYTHELWITHETISRYHRQLFEIETKLAQRVEYGFTRKDKKFLQWTRAQIKTIINGLEGRRRWLLECVQQCHVLEKWYSQYASDAAVQQPVVHSPLTAHGTFGFTTTPAIGTQEWLISNPEHVTQAPCWDSWNAVETLERRMSSPFTSSADSGYGSSVSGGYNTFRQPRCLETIDDNVPWHNGDVIEAQTYTATPESRHHQDACLSEQTKAPAASKSPRYAENAIQLIESRLTSAKRHRRGFSLNDLRTGSD